MAWAALVIAGLLEIVWAYYMKQSEGFTKVLPSILTVLFMLMSFGLLSFAMKSLPLGTSYTIWTGIGAVGSFIVGIVLLGETINTFRVVSALLLFAGLVGLKLSSEH